MLEPLRSPIRPYAWGSHTAIAQLQGRPGPTPEPEAELWLGAHPSGPSVLEVSGRRLDEAISAEPAAMLGAGAVAEFGARLPFMLKVLAAERPLSLQAHPSAEQAAEGYARDQRTGGHNYVDPYHKPELTVAVEVFETLCGFRDPVESAQLLTDLAVPELAPTVAALRGGDGAGSPSGAGGSAALRAAVRGLLVAAPAGLVGAVVAAARRAPRHPLAPLLVLLGEQHPDDRGVVVCALLNRVVLSPEEAIWTPAGCLHAHLRGVGVEVMAASDNVLRGGLTAKRVDIDALLGVLRYEVCVQPVIRATSLGPGLVTWPTPVRDFALHRARVGPDGPASVALPGRGPRIVLCLRGEVKVDDGTGAVTLQGGEAAFAPAGEVEVGVRGFGEVYQAGTAAPR
jgi:mannose-6-phosphate isomerase